MNPSTINLQAIKGYAESRIKRIEEMGDHPGDAKLELRAVIDLCNLLDQTTDAIQNAILKGEKPI